MSPHTLTRPPNPAAPPAIERRPPPAHERWDASLETGLLTLHLETAQGRFVSPGTGRLALVERPAGEGVAQQAARAAGVPVLPGSGIKGAVRTLYELLSFSCDPFAPRPRGSEHCTPAAACDACSLFGTLSWNGRVGFSDAVPTEPEAVRVEVREVPVPWNDPNSPKAEGFRVYDLGRALEPKAEGRVRRERARELAREVFVGRFVTRLAFTNLRPDELGRLCLALGLGGGANGFFLRLGGVKYDGGGAVQVRPHALRRAAGLRSREELPGERCQKAVDAWIAAALRSHWAETFEPKLRELARTLQSGG